MDRTIMFTVVQKGKSHSAHSYAANRRRCFPLPWKLLDDTDRYLKALRAERTVGKIAAKGLTNDDLSVHKVLISCAQWTKRIKEKRIINRDLVLFSDMSSYFPLQVANNVILFMKRLPCCPCVRLSRVSSSLLIPLEYNLAPTVSEMTWGYVKLDLKFDYLLHLIILPQVQSILWETVLTTEWL